MNYEELRIGMTAQFTKTITETDIALFAAVSGDFNPVHVDAVAARESRFGERIAHGMLTASLICPVLGMALPGPGTIHLSQSLRFLRPVRIGDTITAEVEVIELLPEKSRAKLRTSCADPDGIRVLEGEALVQVPRRVQ